MSDLTNSRTPAAPARRPNVLFITTDQWRGDLSPGSGGWLTTPRLDAFASEATRFTRHYTQAYPCGPARASMNTGLYAHKHRSIQNGTPLDARHRTIFQAARATGYDPVLFGYTDTTADPRLLAPKDPEQGNYMGVARGLTTGCLLDEPARPWIADLMAKGYNIPQPWAGRDGVFKLAPFGAPTIFGAEDTEAAFLAGRVIDQLRTQPPEQPFFIHASFIAPHPPFAAPKELLDLIDPDSLPDDPLPTGAADEAHPLVAAYRETVRLESFAPGIEGPVARADAATRRRIRHAYAALALDADRQIGRIFDTLKASGQWDNTIIIFTADHGEQLFDHGMLGKLGWYEGSAHVPLLIRVPGGAGGSVVTGFSQAIDLFPTLVDLLGLEPDVNLDGTSLAPWLLPGTGTARPQEAVYSAHDFRNLATLRMEQKLGLASKHCNLQIVRTDRLKYVHFSHLPPVLYDLQNDPGETRNLAADPGAQALRMEGLELLLNQRLCHENDELACFQGVKGQLYGSRTAWVTDPA